MDVHGPLPELQLFWAKYPRMDCVLVVLSWSGKYYEQQTGLALLKDAEKHSWCLMNFQISRQWKDDEKTPPDLLPSVCRSEELLFGCVFGLVVWSWRSSVWSVLSAKSCWMYHLEYLRNKDVGGHVTTGSECHKGRRGRIADWTVVNQDYTMLKPLNIDLPKNTWVWGLNKSACAYTCAQLQPAGAGMLFSTNQRLNDWVESQVHTRVLSTDSESWADANRQTT